MLTQTNPHTLTGRQAADALMRLAMLVREEHDEYIIGSTPIRRLAEIMEMRVPSSDFETLATAMRAVMQMKMRSHRLVGAIEATVSRHGERLGFGDLTSPQLITFLLSFGDQNFQTRTAVVEMIAAEMASRADTLNSQELATVVATLGRIMPENTAALEQLQPSVIAKASVFDPEGLSRVVHAMVTTGAPVDELLPLATARAMDLRYRFGVQNMTRLLWSLALARHPAERLFRAMEPHAVNLARRHLVDPRSGAALIWAYFETQPAASQLRRALVASWERTRPTTVPTATAVNVVGSLTLRGEQLPGNLVSPFVGTVFNEGTVGRVARDLVPSDFGRAAWVLARGTEPSVSRPAVQAVGAALQSFFVARGVTLPASGYDRLCAARVAWGLQRSGAPADDPLLAMVLEHAQSEQLPVVAAERAARVGDARPASKSEAENLIHNLLTQVALLRTDIQ